MQEERKVEMAVERANSRKGQAAVQWGHPSVRVRLRPSKVRSLGRPASHPAPSSTTICGHCSLVQEPECWLTCSRSPFIRVGCGREQQAENEPRPFRFGFRTQLAVQPAGNLIHDYYYRHEMSFL